MKETMCRTAVPGRVLMFPAALCTEIAAFFLKYYWKNAEIVLY